MDAKSFVARQPEITHALGALRTGRGVLIMGESGVGKTSLATRIASQANDPVRWTVATETSRAIPFGALGPLLPDDLTSLPPLLVPQAIVHSLGRRRGLVVIDDAHWLDEHSATAVLGLVTQRAATVVVTVRTGAPAPDAITALWKDSLLERVDVGAFGLDDTRALLADRLGGPVTDLTVATLWERTGGNPLYLTELVRFGEAEGLFASDGSVSWCHGELGVPPRLTELLERRFAGLSAAARDVVGALALGEPLPLDILAEIGLAEAVDEVDERGLITSHRRAVRLAHPMLTAVATATLSAARRRRLVTTLAAAAGDRIDLVRRAAWQLDAADPPDVELLLAGASAVQLSDPALAGRFAERALAHDKSPRAALALADAHGELGQVKQSWEAVAIARTKASTDDERLAVGFGGISRWFWSDRDPGRAFAELRSLREHLPARYSSEIDAVHALLTMFSAQPAAALVLAERVLATGPAHLAAVRASTARICSLVHADRAKEGLALGERVLATISAGPITPYALGMLHAVMAWGRQVAWEAQVPETGVATGLWPVPDARRGEDVSWPQLDGFRWHIQGKLPEAESRLREGFAHQQRGEGVFRTEVTTELAVVLAENGKPDAAEQLLEQHPPDDIAAIPATRPWARAAIQAARGDPAGARLACDAGAEAAAAGSVVAALWYLAGAARYGAAAAAREVLCGMAEPFESPLSQARAAAIRARVDGTPPVLLAAAEQHAAIGVWGEAVDLAELAGTARAALLATRLRARLNRPAPATRPADALTDRELTVARLARNLTNSEIAGELVISVRTVESHLAAAYRKLGIRSRTQLRDALG